MVDGACRVSSQFAEIGGVVLVHFLGEADVVVAADAASLVLAKEDGPLVFPHHLVELAESALVALEVDEGVLSLLQRSVDGHPPFVLVETRLAQESVHQDVVVQRLFLIVLLPDYLINCLLLILVRVRRFLVLVFLFLLALLSPEDVAFLLNRNLRWRLFYLAELALLLSDVLIRVDYGLQFPLLPFAALAIALLGRSLLLLDLFLLDFLGLYVLHDVLISKINEVILVALIVFLEDVLLQLVRIELILLLLLDLGLILKVGLVHHSDLVLLFLVHELLGVCIGEWVLRRRPLAALIVMFKMILFNHRFLFYWIRGRIKKTSKP